MRDIHTPLVVLDFDGVLVDSFNVCYDINRRAFASAGYILKRATFVDLFSGNIHEKLKGLLAGDEEKLSEFSVLREKLFRERYTGEVGVYPFASKFVRALSKISRVAIASTNRYELIECVLEREHLRHYVTTIFAGTVGKRVMLQRAIDELASDSAPRFFVTDTVGDIIAGKDAVFSTIAVTWGFHGQRVLEKANPDYIAKKHSSVIEFIASRAAENSEAPIR